MNQKNQSTQSTFIFNGDSSFNSLGLSNIKPYPIPQNHQILKFSNSVEYFKNPYQQTLPLKLPKRRMRKQTQGHMLQQTQPEAYRTCIKTSPLRNRQFDQKPWRQQKGKGMYFQNQYQSESIRSRQILNKNSKSLQLRSGSLFSSPEKTSKKHFHDAIINQSTKNPILIGQQPKKYFFTNYEKSGENQKSKRHRGQGFKLNLQWASNKDKQKQQFKNKCNINHKHNSNDYIFIQSARNYTKKEQTYKNPITQGEKPRTYKQIYDLKKKSRMNI